MTIFTKIKRNLLQNIPPTKRWLVPEILGRIGLMSTEHRRVSGVTRDGRRNKYVPHQGVAEQWRRLAQRNPDYVRAVHV